MKNWKNKTFTLLSLIGLSSFGTLDGQNKNAIAETYKVLGNCDMCKKTIRTTITSFMTVFYSIDFLFQ